MRRATSALRRHPGGVLGLAVGVVIVVVLLVTGTVTRPQRYSDRDASEDFLAAWKRSRLVTYAMDGTWKRTNANGETLESPSLIAQRSPDRLVRQLGSMSGEIDGRPVSCFVGPEGGLSCPLGEPLGRTFEQGVDQELRDLDNHFHLGDPPLYRVRTDEHGCYELHQLRPFPDATFGLDARACFDEDSGVLVDYERHFRNGVTEQLTAGNVRDAVVDADFDLSSVGAAGPPLTIEARPTTTPPATATTTSTTTPTNVVVPTTS